MCSVVVSDDHSLAHRQAGGARECPSGHVPGDGVREGGKGERGREGEGRRRQGEGERGEKREEVICQGGGNGLRVVLVGCGGLGVI